MLGYGSGQQVKGFVKRILWFFVAEKCPIWTLRKLGCFIPNGVGAMYAVEADSSLYEHDTDHQALVITISGADGTVATVASYSPHEEFAPAQKRGRLSMPLRCFES